MRNWLRRRCALVSAIWLFLQGGVIAQERPVAVSTLTTTDNGTSSVCVGCTVGTTVASGTLKAGAITLANTGTALTASSANNGTNRINVTNTTSNTAANADYRLEAGTNVAVLAAFSQGYTTSTFQIASSTKLEATGAGGLNFVTSHASGIIGVWTNSLLRWGYNAAGDHTFGTANHIADSNGTPSIQSGFGTTPSITGQDYAFVVTHGSGAGNTGGVVQFGHTYNSAPVCVAIQDGTTITSTSTTTTTVTLSVASATYTGKIVSVLCRGF